MNDDEINASLNADELKLRQRRKEQTSNRKQLILTEGLATLSPYRRIIFYEAIQDLKMLLQGDNRIGGFLTLTDMEIAARVLIAEDETTALAQRFSHLFLN